jgi:hypothetical protein
MLVGFLLQPIPALDPKHCGGEPHPAPLFRIGQGRSPMEPNTLETSDARLDGEKP